MSFPKSPHVATILSKFNSSKSKILENDEMFPAISKFDEVNDINEKFDQIFENL